VGHCGVGGFGYVIAKERVEITPSSSGSSAWQLGQLAGGRGGGLAVPAVPAAPAAPAALGTVTPSARPRSSSRRLGVASPSRGGVSVCGIRSPAEQLSGPKRGVQSGRSRDRRRVRKNPRPALAPPVRAARPRRAILRSCVRSSRGRGQGGQAFAPSFPTKSSILQSKDSLRVRAHCCFSLRADRIFSLPLGPSPTSPRRPYLLASLAASRSTCWVPLGPIESLDSWKILFTIVYNAN
jgi:hypothetical protein